VNLTVGRTALTYRLAAPHAPLQELENNPPRLRHSLARKPLMRRTLLLLFGWIVVSLLAYTTWASSQQPLWEWQGLVREPDRWWVIATMIDAYYAFITFFVWVCFKERSMVSRGGWFIAIMLTGNMAMAIYVLLQISRLRPDEPLSAILIRR
jgi:magnesium-transporting ATPase (P-type)